MVTSHTNSYSDLPRLFDRYWIYLKKGRGRAKVLMLWQLIILMWWYIDALGTLLTYFGLFFARYYNRARNGLRDIIGSMSQ